jgi:anti-sigma factor RsiW
MIEELSAYLDGELDAAGRKRVEQHLAKDPAFRLELQRLERAWGLLDKLPSVKVEESFSRSTMAMVTVAATEELAEQQSELPRQRRLFGIAGAAGLVAAGLLGVVVGHWAWPNPNEQVLRDLPVLEQLDLLRNADSIEFLRELDRQGVFPEEGEHAN